MPLSLIRIYRESVGLSQLQLSAISGISNHRICQIEKGWKKPTPDEIKKISQALNFNFEDIRANPDNGGQRDSLTLKTG